MGVRQFYGEWAKRSFSHSLGKGDFFSSVAGGVVTVVTHYLDPSAARSLAAWTWEIPLWGLAAAMALRVLIAPYELWKEQKARADAIPAELRPFDVTMWDAADEFRLYQAACLWIGQSPPASADDDIPHEAVLVLHRLKVTLRTLANERTTSLMNEKPWVVAFIMLGFGSPQKEAENTIVVDRATLVICATRMGESPRFLFEDEDRSDA